MPSFYDNVTVDFGNRSTPGFSFNGQTGSGVFGGQLYVGISFKGYEIFRGRNFTTVTGNLVGAMGVGLVGASALPKAIFQVYDTHNGLYVNKTDIGGNFATGVCALGWNISRDENSEWKSYGDSGAAQNGAAMLDVNKAGDMMVYQWPSVSGADIVRTAGDVVTGRTWRFVAATKSFVPEADNVSELGTSAKRVKNIFLVNQPTVTSDATTKDNARLLADAEMQAWGSISPKIYSLRGDTMLQAGLLAQDIIAAFTAKGLDITKYSLLMKDANTGLYALRYGECMMFEAAYQRSQVAKLNAAVNKLLTTLGLGGLLGA